MGRFNTVNLTERSALNEIGAGVKSLPGTVRESGALGGIRTHDLSLRRAALYPAELRAPTYVVPRERFELSRP